MGKQFKKGDLVRCIDNSICRADITKGNVYKVTEEPIQNYVTIIDDNKEKADLYATRFELAEQPTTEQPDMVNHPQHYTQGSMECIEAIKSALTEEEFSGFCKANALKYIWRERNKGGKESIEKAIWYLNKMLEM